MSDTLSKMIETLRSKFKLEGEFNGDSKLYEINLDSLDVINFLFGLEQETGVKLPEETFEAEGIETLAQIAAFIDARR